MNKEKGQEIILDNDDCALVIKRDLTVELITPKFNDDQSMTWEENKNMFVAVALSAIMSNQNDYPEFTDIVTKKLNEILIVSQEEYKETCAPDCGSCCGCGPKDETEKF